MLSIVPRSFLHTRGQLDLYSKITAPKKLLVVPPPEFGKEHFLFLLSTPLNEQILRWLDYWLKDVPTGIMDEPPVTIFDSGTQEGRYEGQYPLDRTEWKRLYLHSSHPGKPTRPPYGGLSFEHDCC